MPLPRRKCPPHDTPHRVGRGVQFSYQPAAASLGSPPGVDFLLYSPDNPAPRSPRGKHARWCCPVAVASRPACRGVGQPLTAFHFSPTRKTPPHAVSVLDTLRQAPARGPGFGDEQHGVEELLVVKPRATAGRQQRPQLRPMLARQLVAVADHPGRPLTAGRPPQPVATPLLYMFLGLTFDFAASVRPLPYFISGAAASTGWSRPSCFGGPIVTRGDEGLGHWCHSPRTPAPAQGSPTAKRRSRPARSRAGRDRMTVGEVRLRPAP